MTNQPDHPYQTILDIKFPPLARIDVEGSSITLNPHQGYVVPRGVVHRTRAPQRAVILMVETAAIVPTGD